MARRTTPMKPETPAVETQLEDQTVETVEVVDSEVSDQKATRYTYHQLQSTRTELPWQRFFLNGDRAVFVPLDYASAGLAGFYNSTQHEAIELANFVAEVEAKTGYKLATVFDGEMSQGRMAMFAK